MDHKLKEEIKEVAAFVQELPENLREVAFELILENLLSPDFENGRGATQAHDFSIDNQPLLGEKSTHQQSGLEDYNFPLRVKGFLKKYHIELATLDKLFHIEGNAVEPIWSPTSDKKATAQVQVALLSSLQHAIESGEFGFNIEEVRALCQQHGCYYEKNFTQYFKNNKKYFASLEKEGLVALSDDGMKQLAGLIKSMDQAK